MTPLQLKVIKKAVVIRLSNLENIDEILASYPKLTENEKETIKQELIGN